MKRITKLSLKNFKAFRDQEFNFNGKHALIYGNNGSGKSSLYWALYTFLQSSGKSPVRIREYFQHFDPANEATFQSLKNVFAAETEDAFVKVTWKDDTGTLTEKCISPALINTNDAVTKEANLASDFINYKLLQNFYSGTHKQEVNLWEVFMRDIFPFFDENFLTKTDETDPEQRKFVRSYCEVIEELTSGLPRSGNKIAGKNSAPMTQYRERIADLNQKLELFINRIQRNANEFLSKHFYNGQNILEIVLRYPPGNQISEAGIQAKEKNFQPLDLQIKLSVRVWDSTKADWVENHRPQSFLNEAQLTRIAIGIRVGALLDRLQLTDFKVLCLDDMLISLDMSNRKRVLEWLFNPDETFISGYQLIILTHDREFFEMTKHHIETRKAGEWSYYELYLDTYHGQNQPHVIDSDSDYLAHARKHFNRYEFPACANSLRKECERAIKEFLPPNLCVNLNKEGEVKLKNLDGLIAELEKLFREHGQDFIPLSDLKLYKDVLLNPLSHDNLGTTVHQNELHSLMDTVIPELNKLSSRLLISLYDDKPTFATLTETDSAGVEWKYKIQLFENWREFTFLNGNSAVSKPKCVVIERSSGTEPPELFGEKGRCDHLQDAHRKIRFGLKITDQPEKPLIGIVTVNP